MPRLILSLFSAAALASVMFASPVGAQQASMHQATLSPLNGSAASGTAMVELSGDQVTVTVDVANASPGAPHAQHIHIGGNNTCPPPGADEDGDGVVSTPEGQPSYGQIQVSLTTSGDVTAESALAVDRFPVASEGGQVSYQRTFSLPSGVTASDLANGVIVQHGLADSPLGQDDAAYDGPDSPLMAGVPQEATLPSACGALTAAPSGGVQTGGGGTATASTDTSHVALGGIGVAAGAALGAVAVVGAVIRWTRRSGA